MYKPLTGYPIYIATKSIQRRKHRKWRTNKKWLKRYGTFDIDYMPKGSPVLIDGVIWMTKSDFDLLLSKMR